jgi:predicted transcriptional regulator
MTVALTLRISDELHERLVQAAQSSDRTLNGEIAFQLERSMQSDWFLQMLRAELDERIACPMPCTFEPCVNLRKD